MKEGSPKERYGRFYALLRRMPGADKSTLVYQFSCGRTTHLHEMTQPEYDVMCREMERVAVVDVRREALLATLRKARSGALRQMQLWGVDTTDWARVDAFCQDRRIAGKTFRELDEGELHALNTKLRMMNRKKRENEQH